MCVCMAYIKKPRSFFFFQAFLVCFYCNICNLDFNCVFSHQCSSYSHSLKLTGERIGSPEQRKKPLAADQRFCLWILVFDLDLVLVTKQSVKRELLLLCHGPYQQSSLARHREIEFIEHLQSFQNLIS